MKEKKNKRKAAVLAIFIILALAAVAIYALISPSSVQFPSFPTSTTIQATTQPTGATQKTTTTQPSGNQPVQSTTTVSIPPQTSIVTLEIKNWGFNPNVITISKGSTAIWTNLDSKTHTITSSGNFDSGDIVAGKTWTYTFDKAGTFQYVDKYDSSMQAMVVITES